MHSDTRWLYDIKRASCTGESILRLYIQSPVYYYLYSLLTIHNTLLSLLHIMSGFRYNQFALFGNEASDSDDSGYVEDDSDASGGDHVDHDPPALTPVEQANQADWTVVERREPAVTTRRGARSGQGRNFVRRSQHTVGMIVHHVDLHYFPNNNAPQHQRNVVDLPRGGQVLKKYRMFLVVGRLGNRVRECPIFTYGDRGLRDRDEATWREYCSIRPPLIPAEEFTNQSPNNKVLGIERLHWRGRLSESMVVHLSDVRSRDSDAGVTVKGTILPECREYPGKKMAELVIEATTNAWW